MYNYFLEDLRGYGADKGLKPTSTRTRTRLKSKPILHKNVYVCVQLHVHGQQDDSDPRRFGPDDSDPTADDPDPKLGQFGPYHNNL